MGKIIDNRKALPILLKDNKVKLKDKMVIVIPGSEDDVLVSIKGGAITFKIAYTEVLYEARKFNEKYNECVEVDKNFNLNCKKGFIIINHPLDKEKKDFSFLVKTKSTKKTLNFTQDTSEYKNKNKELVATSDVYTSSGTGSDFTNPRTTSITKNKLTTHTHLPERYVITICDITDEETLDKARKIPKTKIERWFKTRLQSNKIENSQER